MAPRLLGSVVPYLPHQCQPAAPQRWCFPSSRSLRTGYFSASVRHTLEFALGKNPKRQKPCVDVVRAHCMLPGKLLRF